MGETEKKMDFVLIKKEHRQFMQSMKAIPGEFQHALVIADINKKKIRAVLKKMCAVRREISLLKDVKIIKRFEEKVIKLFWSVKFVGTFHGWGLKGML